MVESHSLQLALAERDDVAVESILMRSPRSRRAADGLSFQTSPAFSLPPGQDANDLPHMAVSGDTAVWVTTLSRYRIDLVRMDGTVVRTLTREPPWLRGASSRHGAPKVSFIRELGDGVLMVMMLVPDPRQDPNLNSRTPRPMTQVMNEPVYDTIIELVDIERGEILATARYDEFLRLVRDSHFLYTTREAPDGDVYFDIYTPQLNR